MISGKYFVQIVEYLDIVSTTGTTKGERMNYGTMAERVARGIEWLDKVAPDWRDNVSLTLLDLSDWDSCILAQVAQSCFLEAWESLNGELGEDYRERQIMLGFDVSTEEFRKGCDDYYKELTDAWLDALSV